MPQCVGWSGGWRRGCHGLKTVAVFAYTWSVGQGLSRALRFSRMEAHRVGVHRKLSVGVGLPELVKREVAGGIWHVVCTHCLPAAEDATI
jgi:hypothetical protein